MMNSQREMLIGECQACQTSSIIDDGERFCCKCGSPLEIKFSESACPRCKKQRKTLEEGNYADFCAFCQYGFACTSLDGKMEENLHYAVAKSIYKDCENIIKKSNDKNKILHEEFNKSQFPEELEGTCLEAEIPLSIAVWNLDIQIIKLLIRHGAQIDHISSEHENVFHVLVKKAEQMGSAGMKTVVNIFEILIEMTMEEDKLLKAFRQLNKEGYSPLALSAKLLTGELYRAIINCPKIYKKPVESGHGFTREFSYDITELDSAVGPGSVMQVVGSKRAENIKQFLMFTDASPLLDIIGMKWRRYRYQFWGWAAVHLAFCIVPVVYISVIIDWKRIYGFKDHHFYQLKPVPPHPNMTNVTDESVAVIVTNNLLPLFLLIYFLYGTFLLLVELFTLIKLLKESKTYYWHTFSTLENIPYQLVMLSYGILSTVSLIMFFACPEQLFMALALTMIFGWIFLLQFIRCFKIFSYFTEILYQAFAKNLIQLAAVYVLILPPFAAALTGAFNGKGYICTTFFSCAVALFQTTLGLSSIDEIYEAESFRFANLIYIVHAIITYVLLFNILIALLSQTAAETSTSKTVNYLWHLHQLNIILLIESHLLQHQKLLCGERRASSRLLAENDWMNSPRYFLKVRAPKVELAQQNETNGHLFQNNQERRLMRKNEEYKTEYHPELPTQFGKLKNFSISTPVEPIKYEYSHQTVITEY